MTGYSGVPQARKLGLMPGQRLVLDAPPVGWAIAAPLDGLRAADDDGGADVILAFFRTAAEIAERLPALGQRVFPAGVIWALWPRRAAGHASDITDNVVRSCALGLGLVDVKVAAADDDWSGLRLVWRSSNRRPTPALAQEIFCGRVGSAGASFVARVRGTQRPPRDDQRRLG